MDASDFIWCALGVLERWQTLIGAVLALGAAAWTIRIMKKQMREDQNRHERAAERKKYATRSQLPEALSALSAYVRAVVRAYLDGAEPPNVAPIDAVNTLKLAIEFVDDAAAARLFELVSWYQVWSARLEGMHNERLDENTLLYDSALLNSYVGSLFEYARNEADSVELREPNREEMNNSLRNVVTLIRFVREAERFNGALELIERRHGDETLD